MLSGCFSSNVVKRLGSHSESAKCEALWSQAVMNTLDGIIDTVSAPHEISSLLPLLKTNGKLILLGVPTEPHSFSAGAVLFKRYMLWRHIASIPLLSRSRAVLYALQPFCHIILALSPSTLLVAHSTLSFSYLPCLLTDSGIVGLCNAPEWSECNLSVSLSVQMILVQADHWRQLDWRHQGDAGDAGLLRREGHCVRC